MQPYILIFKGFYLPLFYAYMFVWLYVYESCTCSAHGGQKCVRSPGIELWVLRIEPVSSGKAANAFNCSTISLVPFLVVGGIYLFLIKCWSFS